MNQLAAPFLAIYRHRKLLYRTGYVQLKSTYAGSVIGLFWIILGPLILLALYTLVFAVGLQLRPTGMNREGHILYMFSGLVPYWAFSSALVAGTTSLSKNKDILLNTVFPPELVPLRASVVNSVVIVSGLAIVCIAGAVVNRISPVVVMVPFLIVLQVMFIGGVNWVLTLMHLVLGDIQHILSFVTISLLIASPIAYTPDMMPLALKGVVYLNPLSYFIIPYQHLMVLGTMPPVWIMVVTTVMSVTAFVGGYWIFQRAKTFLFDYA